MREVQPFKQQFWSNWAPKDREQQKQKQKLKKNPLT